MGRYLARGLTQQQIVEAWLNDSGVQVSRSAIAMAIDRYGLQPTHPRPRYEDMLPWRVRSEHKDRRDAYMLRLEGRRRSGGDLTSEEVRELNHWKLKLLEAGAIIAYAPETDEGFWWVQREKGDDPAELIRRDPIVA